MAERPHPILSMVLTATSLWHPWPCRAHSLAGTWPGIPGPSHQPTSTLTMDNAWQDRFPTVGSGRENLGDSSPSFPFPRRHRQDLWVKSRQPQRRPRQPHPVHQVPLTWCPSGPGPGQEPLKPHSRTQPPARGRAQTQVGESLAGLGTRRGLLAKESGKSHSKKGWSDNSTQHMTSDVYTADNMELN